MKAWLIFMQRLKATSFMTDETNAVQNNAKRDTPYSHASHKEKGFILI